MAALLYVQDEFMHLVMATLHRTERLGKACLGCVSLSSLEVVQQQVRLSASGLNYVWEQDAPF